MVIAKASGDDVSVVAPEQIIVPGIAPQHIVICSAIERVIAETPIDVIDQSVADDYWPMRPAARLR